MSCDFPKLLEKHLAYDLIYRFFLWAGIALLFYFLASLANDQGGNAIAKAVHKDDKWNVLGPSALIVWSIGCLAKNVTLKLTESTWGHSFGACITSILCKIATDMLLATFGLGASFLGYLTYYVHFEHPATAPISVNIFLGVGFFYMLGMLFLLGICIAILKAKSDSEVAQLMRKIRWKWVFSIYPLVIVVMGAIVWSDG